MYRYNDLFYQYVTAGAQRSARFILPWLFERLSIRSVVDLGAGQGAWLAVWRELGVQDVVGVDGPSVPADTLLVDVKYFRFFDLQEPIDLGRTFDLVQSLEVGEHIAPGHVKTFIDS